MGVFLSLNSKLKDVPSGPIASRASCHAPTVLELANVIHLERVGRRAALQQPCIHTESHQNVLMEENARMEGECS